MFLWVGGMAVGATGIQLFLFVDMVRPAEVEGRVYLGLPYRECGSHFFNLQQPGPVLTQDLSLRILTYC